VPLTCSKQNDNVIGTQLSASSPDEEAFVYAGERFGYKFVNRSKDIVTIEIAGRGRMQYRVVCMLPYTQVGYRDGACSLRSASSSQRSGGGVVVVVEEEEEEEGSRCCLLRSLSRHRCFIVTVSRCER
jgi:hypothetical protein